MIRRSLPVAVAAAVAGLLAAPGTGFAAPAVEASSPAVEAGRTLFMQKNCYFCHGTQAQGSQATGPALAPKPLAADAIRAYVRHPTGQMPPFSPEILSDGDIDSIHAYLASIPAGRPASEIPLLGGTAPAGTGKDRRAGAR